MSLTAAHPPLAQAQRKRTSSAPAFAAALVMHLALVAALWLSVQWHTTPASPAIAVMWTTPDPAPEAPSTPQPTPSPPQADQADNDTVKPDIAIKADKHPPKPKKPAPEPVKNKSHDNTKPSKAELAKAEALMQRSRNEQLTRAFSATTGVPGPVPMVGSPGRMSSEYEARIRAAVLANLHFSPPDSVDPNLYAEYDVSLIASTGELNGEPRLVHASTIPGWDEAVLRAIQRTDPFPLQADGRTPSHLNLRFKPVDAHR